jgi:hypothetical protein
MGINVIADVKDLATNAGSIYPNPASDWVKWSLPSGFIPNKESVKVYSLDGKLIPLKINEGNDQILFDISTLPQGNYEVQLRSQSGLLIHNRMNKL